MVINALLSCEQRNTEAAAYTLNTKLNAMHNKNAKRYESLLNRLLYFSRVLKLLHLHKYRHRKMYIYL